MVEEASESVETERTMRAVVLRAGTRILAVDALEVLEIALRGRVTRVPHSPPYLHGLSLISGRLMPVFSLRILLGSEPGPPAQNLPRLVILSSEAGPLAFACDEARGVAVLELRDDVGSGNFEAHCAVWDEGEIGVLNTRALVEAAMAHTKERTH